MRERSTGKFKARIQSEAFKLAICKEIKGNLLLERAHRDNLDGATEYARKINQKFFRILDCEMFLKKSRPDVSNFGTGTPTQSTYQWQTFQVSALMIMCSHSIIPESITSEPLPSSFYGA